MLCSSDAEGQLQSMYLYFAIAIEYNIIAELLSEATNCDALSLRVCMYCNLHCIYEYPSHLT